MIRRDFLKAASVMTAALAAPAAAKNRLTDNSSVQTVLKPGKLKKGDKIGLIAPGSFITEKELEESVNNIKSLGFEPVYTERVLARSGYLGGSDTVRANDVNYMFGRKDINGIICVRGGYGCQRILPMLDYELIKNNPKVLSGYSDITALLYGIYAKTGLVGFHGPVATSTFNKFSVNYFTQVLCNPSEKLTMTSATDENPNDECRRIRVIRNGKAEGQLVGGNLSIVVSLVGTPYDLDTKGKIVFLEEVGEQPYRVDRLLTQLIQSGKLSDAAGIALGVFTDCEADKSSKEFTESFTLSEVLYDRLFSLGIPVIYGLSFGHIVNKFTLPFGIKARLDVDNQQLSLLEPAVL